MADMIAREAAAQLVESLITCDEERVAAGECCCCTKLEVVADAIRSEDPVNSA